MFTIRHRREAREPVPDERVAALLEAAAAPTEPGPASGETAALAAFRASHQSTGSGRSRLLSSPTALKTAAAATIGVGVLLTGGVAAAQTGSLPGAAQYIAQRMLDNVGVSVPGPNEHSAGHPEQRGSSDAEHPSGPDSSADSTDSTDSTDATGGDPAAEHAGKGAAISEMAKTPMPPGDKGALVSQEASGGTSKADAQHGKAEAPDNPASGSAAPAHTGITTPNTGGTSRPEPASSNAQGAGASQDRPPVPVPNDGGNGTADAARSGASDSGTTIAGERSGGRSTAGSGNADSHTDNRPGNRP